ncbi:MAG: C4-type zinc ribbon domain-containing protein [Actinomycetota bacterium]|nr:C4-type zinc ribbon domain-containing protein [Actinomycetota bacterium]
MTVFDVLLRVQEHDTAVDQLRHRRATLPELAEVRRIDDELVSLEATLAEVGARRDDVARRQKRLEAELAAVEAKITEIEGRLYSGAVTVPRELQAMQAEVESLRRRQSSLEDDVLEAMTEREPLDEEVEALEATRARHDDDAARLRAAVAEAEVAIDAEMARERQAREQAVAGVPPEVSRLYEDLRRRLGGVGAARLVNGRCSGCHLTLPATELDRIRREPPEALIRCDQCGRVLVR